MALYADIGRQLRSYNRKSDAFAALATTAVARVPGAEWASITQGRPDAFTTIAATDPAAREVDQIQYRLGSGPCVDAILQETVFRTGDLAVDPRWPTFGREAVRAGARSMLSHRLFLEDDDDLIVGLNLYSTKVGAFDDTAQTVGTLLATHGALAVSAAAARERIAQLQRALATNRDIGVAMGVLMHQYRITRDDAFTLLRVASQNTNRKLADLAADVGDTGTLDLPGLPGSARRTGRPPARGQRRTSPPSDGSDQAP